MVFCLTPQPVAMVKGQPVAAAIEGANMGGLKLPWHAQQHPGFKKVVTL